MKIKITRNFLKIENSEYKLFRTLIHKKFHSINKKTNNSSEISDESNNVSLFKNVNFNFSRHKKNLESMKFEVFKTNKDSASKSNLNQTTTASASKTKPQQHDKKHHIKPDSNLKSTKHSELHIPSKHHTNSHASSTTQSHKDTSTKKEIKIDRKKTIDIDPDNPNSYKFYDKSKSEPIQSAKFEAAKTIVPIPQEKTILNSNKIQESPLNDTEKDDLDSIQNPTGFYGSEESIMQSKDTPEEENLNEAELEFLAQKDHQRFNSEESEAFAGDDSTAADSTISLPQYDFPSDKDSYSEQEFDLPYETQSSSALSLNEILNLYASDPLYKKRFDETKRVLICEMLSDIRFTIKWVTVLNNFSCLFILSQLLFQGFTLPSIFIYIYIRHFSVKYLRGFKDSVVKILADPATLRIDVYTINMFGIEVCRKFSMFQLMRNDEGYDIFGYSYYKEELFRDDFMITKVCKIHNENFFRNMFFFLTTNLSNEFVFKYFQLMYSFTKRELNDNDSNSPEQQEKIFKSIVKDFFTNFPNYQPYLKEKLNKNFEQKSFDYDNRSYIMFVLYCWAFFIFMIDYFVYKYVICVYYNEIEGGIDKLYEEERKKKIKIICYN